MASNSRARDAQDWQLTKNTVLERNRYMFNNPLMSDIKLTCGEPQKELHAHKYVLATSSPVFYAMFYGNLAEKNSIIALPDTDEESFKVFLYFLYTDECTLTAENTLKLLYLARKYMIPSLIAKCTTFIENNTKPENLFTILEQVMQSNEKELEQRCWRMVDSQTTKAVTSDSFYHINHATLLSLLKRGTLNIKEIELLRAVLNWSEVQCSTNGLEVTNQNKRSVLGDAIYEIYFLAMSQQDFVQYVSLPGLLTPDEAIPIIHTFNGFSESPTRWKLSCKKRQHQLMVRCCRFPAVTNAMTSDTWNNKGELDLLLFKVNKPFMFHGVCLFGDTICSKYEVWLEFKELRAATFPHPLLRHYLFHGNVRGIYTSEHIDRGVYGFDVFLPTPVAVNEDNVVEITASIKGPTSCSGEQGKGSIEMDRFTVTFHDGSYSESKTTSKRGQFYQILISD